MEKILVNLKPGSTQEKIIRVSEDEYTVFLRAKPHDGEANTALIKMLSKHFHVPKTTIKITRGSHSRNKILEI